MNIPREQSLLSFQAVTRDALWDRKFLAALLVAVTLHAPFAPGLRSLVTLWMSDESEADDEGDNDEALVPVELDSTPSPTAAAPPPPQPPEPPAPEPIPPPAQPEAPPALPPEPTAPPVPAPPAKPQAPVDDLKVIKQIAKNPNNVQVVLVGSELRKSPTGRKLSGLLPRNPQWAQFFEGASVDPISDVDVMVITGPRFSVSDQVIAILKFHEAGKLKPAVEGLIARTEGKWLEGLAVDAAVARAGDGERLFAIPKGSDLLYVMPSPFPVSKNGDPVDEKAQKAAEKVARAQTDRVKAAKFKDFSAAGFAIDAYMIQPWKLVSKTGRINVRFLGEIEVIPMTLKTARIVVRVLPTGAAIELTFTSESEAQASADAASLNSVWPAAQGLVSSEVGIDLPPLNFTTAGATVEAKVDVDENFLEQVFRIGNEANEAAIEKSKKPKKKGKKESK